MTHGVTRLKELLFDTNEESESLSSFERRIADAARRLKALEDLTTEQKKERLDDLRRLEGLFERAGSQDRFSKSVAAVLDGALREAEVTRHDQLSRAMAPLVVNTVRSELRNSQDEMVQALYPLTGRMVKAYVASAIKDLTEQINRRLEQNPVSLRLRSIVSGTPVSDLAIAESQRLKVDEIYLVRRGSGALLGRWPDSGASLSNSDIHMSGVLSAINDFASHAFSDDGGSLRTFALDDFHIYLRASPLYLVAAKCRGIAPTGAEAIIDEGFLELLEKLQELPTDAAGQPAQPAGALAPFADTVEARTTEIYDRNDRAGLGFNPLRLLLFLVAVPVLAGLIWWGYTEIEKARTQRIADEVVRAMPVLAGYKTEVEAGYRGHTLSVSGLMPSEDVRRDLLSRLGAKLPSTEIQPDLGVLPTPEVVDPTPRIEALRLQLATLEADVLRRQFGGSLYASAQRLAVSIPELVALEQVVSGDEAKARVRGAIVVARRVEREIGTLRARLVQDGDMIVRRAQMVQPIGALASQIRGATAEVSGLLGGREAQSPATTQSRGSAGVSMPESAEAALDILAAESAKLTAMTLAVTKAIQQAGLIKIPEPVPPPPPVAPREPTAREKLAAFVTQHAVFFSNGSDFRDPALARVTLDTLAELMAGNGEFVRIIGYTDETGGSSRNNPLAASRAEAVLEAMVKRGVARERMVALGRADGLSVSPLAGAGSPNRRVEFELGFVGEVRR